jgi:hypothetical protein
MGTEPERLWTEREFSDFFGRVSLRTLRRWRQEGSGPAYVKVGRKVMYRPSDVQTWLDELRIESEKDDRRTASDRRGPGPPGLSEMKRQAATGGGSGPLGRSALAS